ncbi:TetR family transcriptional regulator [Yersinia enterocolitica]|uniref:HTH-type transcriptional regulator RutR n=1 Tax=Yersinia enterocolitica TaxID=630 RepID=UPI0002819745|nr:HTH-type transcriptional regulator RutR [Yersinia enterocolitica]AJI82823.1 HTH-type transcriptional regulator RutR [Yersinia enterocolitica]EKA27706.1 TetR family transcriptional regulator [Yersinia enterocolitica subsp. enterocolitica WA-314]ELI8284588.1 HTH-type transcriptional regulator RutR [Yersinia enterocolitica]KGA71830.1 HTH-type transcriptional regulator RutR [Yersinia enterocolitica]KGA78997.1 HTH-type transcriptional regulator RutR [Yersinia enterocolitica]
MKLATSDTPALEIKPSRRSKAGAAKRQLIMTAALELFSLYGIHGTSLDQVAERADVSKTNLLYYFPSKEALYIAVLKDILAIWLAPLKALQADQQPIDAIRHYIALKLAVSRDHPQASRLFCLEMIQGAPLLKQELAGELKTLFDDKVLIIRRWMDDGLIAKVEPQHFIFMLWATTQHYADFSAQIEAISGKSLSDKEFFQQTVESVQQLVIGGIARRDGEE